MVTRGRPKRALAAIEIAKSLASGAHELEFIVCADDDDAETQETLKDYRQSIAPAPIALGEIWNRGAALIPDADVICPIVDDSFIACADWDDKIAYMLANLPPHTRLLGWNDQANKGLMTLPIVGADWYKAAGLYPGWFPYWFYDTWVAEVYSFVTGALPYLPPELLLVAKKGTTQRMRDLGFWWKFYSAMRPERLAEAERLRAHFGVSLTPENIKRAVDYWTHRDTELTARIPQMEANMTGEQMPSERYMTAKIAAEAKMATL